MVGVLAFSAPMKITKVCCQGCGADLEVDEDVRYVTCNYCHARLEVVHDTSVTHTRILEKLEKNTDRMAGNLRVIELQNDLERLDREWEGRKERFMMTGKHGRRYLPSRGGSIAVGSVMIILAIFWIIATVSKGSPGVFSLFGVLFLGFAIYTIIGGCSKAAAYGLARDEFHQHRDSLIRRIEEERRD